MTAIPTETLRKKAYAAVVAALGDAYDCERQWSEWSYGTMGEDDFLLLAETPGRVNEIAEAALSAVGFEDILHERNKLRAAVSAMHDFLNRNYRVNGRCLELDCESHSQAWSFLQETRDIIRAAFALQEPRP